MSKRGVRAARKAGQLCLGFVSSPRNLTHFFSRNLPNPSGWGMVIHPKTRDARCAQPCREPADPPQPLTRWSCSPLRGAPPPPPFVRPGAARLMGGLGAAASFPPLLPWPSDSERSPPPPGAKNPFLVGVRFLLFFNFLFTRVSAELKTNFPNYST